MESTEHGYCFDHVITCVLWVKRGNIIRIYECLAVFSDGQLPEPFHIHNIHNNRKLKVNEDFRHISISPSVNIHLYFYGNRAAASHYA